MKRLCVLLMVLVILVASFPVWAITAIAVPQTHPNTYVNTGDQRADIIGVALTQVGYREGPNNDTKYGDYFNLNYHAWCGLFVSWCAVQAGVPDKVLIKTGIANPASYGLTQKPAGYIPKSGDLYFTPNYGHVGIVYYVEGEYFYSIEGNTWDSTYDEGVYIRKKLIRDVVFASPNYSGGRDCNYVQGVESAHPHKEYYKCGHCGDFYYTGKTMESDSCQTCRELKCTHSFSSYQSTGSASHQRVCENCGKKESSSHSWNSGTTVKAATCKEAGSKEFRCTVCDEEKSEIIPKKTEHDYSEWELKDQQSHTRKCAVCNHVETKDHQLEDEFETDQEQHWKTCDICQELIGEEEHRFGAFCDSPCEVCDYVREGGHPYAAEWSVSDTEHWKACANCDAKDLLEGHVFDAACDETCSTCEYTRETQHHYSENWITDGQFHWYECSVCGQVKDLQSHDASYVARKGAIQYCTICDLRLTSDAEHIHGYDMVVMDENYHEGTCSCGMDMPREVHVWELQSGTCQICGALYPEPMAVEEDKIPLIAGCVGGVGLFLVIALLAFARKKR